jgi:hypothetical protein
MSAAYLDWVAEIPAFALVVVRALGRTMQAISGPDPARPSSPPTWLP